MPDSRNRKDTWLPEHTRLHIVPRREGGHEDIDLALKRVFCYSFAYASFATLKNGAITVNKNRTSVTVTLPKPQLEPAVLNVNQSYVYAQQQGLFNRVGNFFSGNPNSQQQVYQIAQGKIETAARQSPLLADAQKNTEGMLTGMLTSLGFQHVTVTFVAPAAG